MLHAKERAVLEAKKIASGACCPSAPVDIAGVARELGVASVEPRPLHIDGYLGRSRTGDIVIRYNEANTPRRNRFTIAHEIGHLLIARCEGRQIVGQIGRTWDRDPAEERLANRIAAELLMPEAAMCTELSRRRVEWETIFALCGRFEVSTTALVSRLFELPSLLALLFNVDLPQRQTLDAPVFSCRVSRGFRAGFTRPPRAEANDILNAASSASTHACCLLVDSQRYELALPARRMESGPKPQLWALGWKVV